MEFFFPEDNLNRMTPEETQISDLSVKPYPDGSRLHVNIEITPFQKRPYVEVTLNDVHGNEAASVSIIEPMTWKLEFTMHVRGEIQNPYTLEAKLFYPDGPTAEPRKISFDVEPPPAQTEADSV